MAMDSTTLMELADTWGAHNYKPLPVVLSHGEGAFVWDVEGRRYLDFLSCYSALNHGHRHPRLVQAAREQMDRITLTSRAFHNAEMGPFLQELCAYAGQEMALLMNSGAEAVETALKAARKWAYRVKGVAPGEAEIIACAGNFHGRTISIVSFSTEPLYRDDFGPFTPGFRVIPYGDLKALREAIRLIREERLAERSAELGMWLLDALRGIPSPHVREVRGRGLFIGVELHPEAGGARRFCEALMAEGLLCKETHDHVIRFAPPLVIGQEALSWAVQRVAEVLR